MYRNVQITQEMLSEFCEKVHTDLIKLKEDSKLKNEMISKLNEQMIAIDLKIETNKIFINEKNENLIFRLSVINEKMKDLEQKMNDLNKIMMKHFAYKKQIEITPTTQSTNVLQSTNLPQNTNVIQPVNNLKPNPFSFNPPPPIINN
jgi:hypothetical protein